MNKDDSQVRIDFLTEAAADRQLDLLNAINSAGAWLVAVISNLLAASAECASAPTIDGSFSAHGG